MDFAVCELRTFVAVRGCVSGKRRWQRAQRSIGAASLGRPRSSWRPPRFPPSSSSFPPPPSSSSSPVMAGLVAATEPPVAEGGFRDHRTPLDPQLQGDLELPASCADDVLPDDDAPLSVPDEAGDSEGGKLKMIFQLLKKLFGVKDVANMFVSSPSSFSLYFFGTLLAARRPLPVQVHGFLLPTPSPQAGRAAACLPRRMWPQIP